MKALLLIGCIIFSTVLQAQGIKPDIKKLVEKSPLLQQQESNVAIKLPKTDTLKLQAYLDQLRRGKGRGIKILPQDNMPFIVPDTNAITAIPNLLPHYNPPAQGRIPNATPEWYRPKKEDGTK